MSKQTTAPPTAPPADNGAMDVLLQRISALETANATLETANADLTGRLSAAGENAPPEGSLLLTQEQAAEWSAYGALGKPAALETMQGAYTGLQRKAVVTDAANAHGYKADVLARLIGNMPLEMKETVDAKGVKSTYAVITDGDKDAQELGAYVTANLNDFLPSLETNSAGETITRPFVGQQFPNQPPAARGGQDKQQNLSVVQQQLARSYKKRPQA